MKIEIHNHVSDFDSYRSARVKSLFNAENGCNFDLEIDGVDISGDWCIGAVVGASGSGKTSIGKMIFGENKIVDLSEGWSNDKPMIDAVRAIERGEYTLTKQDERFATWEPKIEPNARLKRNELIQIEGW